MTNYNNPFSVDHRKPVFMDSSDPRNKNLERYRSRLGRDLAVTTLGEVKTLAKYNTESSIVIHIYDNNVPPSTDTGDNSGLYVALGVAYGDYTSVGERVGKTNIPNGSYYFNDKVATYSPSLPTQDVSGLTVYERNDDFALPITLPFNVKLGTYIGNLITISNNGGIIFGQSFTFYTWVQSPLSSFNYPIIWGLWYDIDTRNELSGRVYYGTKIDQDGREYFQLSFKDVGYYQYKIDYLTSFDIKIYKYRGAI